MPNIIDRKTGKFIPFRPKEGVEVTPELVNKIYADPRVDKYLSEQRPLTGDEYWEQRKFNKKKTSGEDWDEFKTGVEIESN